MSRREGRTVDSHAVDQLLGRVSIPGSLDDLIHAMQHPWGNVMRRRREVPPEALPIPSIPIPWYSLGHRPTVPSPKPSRTLAYAAADYFVQDAGSLLALAVAGADSFSSRLRGQLICDLCAAPGGKASALVEAIEDNREASPNGFVLANEVIRSRLGALQLNLARTGSDRYAVSSLDPEALAERLPGVFDLVLVDAPCSGQTLVARGKQTLASFSPSQVQHSAARQRRILDAAVKLLRDGGRLVYSTCTFAVAENEAQVERLIDEGIATEDPVDSLEAYRSSDSGYRLWPHLHQCAGSFAASVGIRRATTELPRFRPPGSERRLPDDLRGCFGEVDSAGRLWQNDSVVIGWPEDAPPWVEAVAVSGPELAYRAGRTWKPSHAAALRRIERWRSVQSVDLEAEPALRYLRGETIRVDFDGWLVARYQGRPLGWVKGSGGVGKNHLPSQARFAGALAIEWKSIA